MNIVITGGAGYIGRYLVDYLGERDEIGEIVVVDNLRTGIVPGGWPKGVRLIQADFCSWDRLEPVLRRADVVYHLAAIPNVIEGEDDLDAYRINGMAVGTFAEHCEQAGVKRFIFTSSAAVYSDEGEQPRTEWMQVRAKSDYGGAKIEAERKLFEVAVRSRRMSVCTARLFNVYGSRKNGPPRTDVVTRYMLAALGGKTLEVRGYVRAGVRYPLARDFIHVRDVAYLLRGLGLRDQEGYRIVNVGTNQATTVMDLVRWMEGEVASVRYEETLADNREIQRSCADCRLLRAMFPEWHPIMLADGLRDMWITVKREHAGQTNA